AGLEGQGDRDTARRARGRAEIQQVVDAGELLLDDLGDRLLGGARVGARIGRVDRDLWRGDVRVRLHAHVQQRDHAAERDQDRDDPGEDRVVDEETWHGGSVPSGRFVAAFGRGVVAL